MERTEKNWTLLPFCAFALAFSLLLCSQLEVRGAAAIGVFLLLFLAGLLAGAVLFLLALWVISLFIDTKKPQKEYAPFYSAVVTFAEGIVPAFFRVRIHVRGAAIVPAEGRWLLVENHRSGFDPLVTGWVLRRHRFGYIAKPQIMAIPVVGPFMHKACCFGIDRENDRAALRTILDAAALIREDVVSLGIYPEGTRNTGEGLLPFRNGAFKIAQKAKAPIVVAAIRGTEIIMRNFPWKPTDVYLEFRAVLDTGTVAALSTGEIGERVRELILPSP